jgi:hypothetical protein
VDAITVPAYVEALRQAIAAPNDNGTVSIGLEDAVDLLASAPSAPIIDPDYATHRATTGHFLVAPVAAAVPYWRCRQRHRDVHRAQREDRRT